MSFVFLLKYACDKNLESLIINLNYQLDWIHISKARH